MGIEKIRIMNLTPLPFASPLLAPTALSGHHKGGRIEDGALFSLFFFFYLKFWQQFGNSPNGHAAYGALALSNVGGISIATPP